LLNICYTVILREIDLLQLFKEIYVLKGGNLRGFFFSLIDDSRIKRKLGTREKKTLIRYTCVYTDFVKEFEYCKSSLCFYGYRYTVDH